VVNPRPDAGLCLVRQPTNVEDQSGTLNTFVDDESQRWRRLGKCEAGIAACLPDGCAALVKDPASHEVAFESREDGVGQVSFAPIDIARLRRLPVVRLKCRADVRKAYRHVE
jgi:hypothetical protein